ncbi:MAG: hypothetical protein LBK71_07400 [Verrucomicrobiales bacterium]|jgi:hypothetical protein|nr:hypothetical protein [Verrucomicrobiales bacterium]
MKTKYSYQYPEPIKGFHTVEFFRKIKTRISKEISGMTYDEYRAWAEKHRKKYASRRMI